MDLISVTGAEIRMNKFGSILGLIFLLTFAALAQSPQRPSAKYGGTNSNPRLIELSNLAGDSEGCVKRGPYVGKLVQRKFDDDEITLIGFVLRDSKDQRTYINLDDEQIDRMLMVDRGYLSTFLVKGKRVKVWVYACGAAGRVLYADRIVAL